MEEHIEIEEMLFGDFRVQVWGKDLDSKLDREYFCRGLESAVLTAMEVKSLPGFDKLDIYLRKAGEEESVMLLSHEQMTNPPADDGDEEEDADIIINEN